MNYDVDLVKQMYEYTNEVKKMSKEESVQALIRIGVLDKNGSVKENICTVEEE